MALPLQICWERARDVLGSEVELASSIVMTINSDVLQLEVSSAKRGWEVVPEKNPEVAYNGHHEVANSMNFVSHCRYIIQKFSFIP